MKGGIASFESSAKEAINVEQAFQEAARKALAQEMQHDQYNDFPDQIQLNANTPSQQPREGCSCWVHDLSRPSSRDIEYRVIHESKPLSFLIVTELKIYQCSKINGTVSSKCDLTIPHLRHSVVLHYLVKYDYQ